MIFNCILLFFFKGPCPPCPQTVSVKCYCTKSGAQVRRCSAQTWSCDKVCSSLLSCREHRCNQICHPPPCLPCPRKSSQKCLCGSRAEERPCQDIEFQCSKVHRFSIYVGINETVFELNFITVRYAGNDWIVGTILVRSCVTRVIVVLVHYHCR